MKRICLLSILCWAVMSLVAQNFTVSSMSAAPMDISASQYERKDINGDPCALIKVQLPAVGARFEGNVIGEPEFKTGEYWVYMSSGSQMLRVKHPNVLPLTVTFQDYGIKSVQAKQTYELVLIMPQLIGQEFDDGMRYLVMTVTPAHSIVYIDGQLQQVNNGTVSRRLSMGKHTYRVEAVGFAPQNGTVELGDGKKSLPITLKSVQATLNVTCPTSGSNIYINDQLRGTAPWQGELTAGDYLVEARLNSYRSHRQNITLRESEQRTLAMPALVPITSSLDVNYQPVETEVWLDGKQLGTSPDIFRGVLVGSHQVELRKSGYSSKTVTITVEEGKTASLIGNLENIQTKQTASSSSSSYTSSSSSSSISYTGSGSSSISKFFPYGGITLGSTKTSELSGLGFTKSSSSNYYKAPSGFFAYDENEDGYMDKILTSQGDGFPSNWTNLGFDWSMTYNQMVDLFKRLNFTMKVTINPHTVKSSSGRNTLEARIEATSPDGQMMIRTDFEGGNHNGEGYSVNSRNTLGFIFIFFNGVPGRNSSSSSSSSSSSTSTSVAGSTSSPTIEYLFTHPMLFLDGSDISLSRSKMESKLGRLISSNWRIDHQPSITYLRPNGTGAMVNGRAIEYMYCRYHDAGYMNKFEIDFNDSQYNTFSSAKQWAERLVEGIRSLGFSVTPSFDSQYQWQLYRGSNGEISYEVRLPQKYPGQLYIEIWYKSANAYSTLGTASSSSSSYSSSSSSSYSVSSTLSDVSLENLLLHPAATLESPVSHNINRDYTEIKNKHANWKVKKEGDCIKVDASGNSSVWQFDSDMSMMLDYSGGKLINFSYYFDGSELSRIKREMTRLGLTVKNESAKRITFNRWRNLREVFIDFENRWVWLNPTLTL